MSTYSVHAARDVSPGLASRMGVCESLGRTHHRVHRDLLRRKIEVEVSAASGSRNSEAALCFNAPVEAGDSEGVGGPGDAGEARALHEGEHLRWLRKAVNRRREIAVGASGTGDCGTDGGKDSAEVEGVELSGETLRLAEVEDAEFAAWVEHAVKFVEAGFVVSEIAEAE